MAGENVKKWEKFVNLDCPNLSQKNVEIAKKANPRMQRSIRKIFEVLPKYGPPKHYETWLSKTKHWKNSKKGAKKTLLQISRWRNKYENIGKKTPMS